MREATLHEVKRGAPNRGRRDNPGAVTRVKGGIIL